MPGFDDYLVRLPPAHREALGRVRTVVGAVRSRLGGCDLARGTIRFAHERPVPDHVLADVAGLRLRELTTQS